MTPFRPKGRRIWTIKVPTRGGKWRNASSGTRDGATARRMHEMVAALGPLGAHAWDVLHRVHTKSVTLSSLYDLWLATGKDVARLRLALRAENVEPMVEKYLASASCTEDTKSHYRTFLNRLIPPGEFFSVADLTTERVQKVIDETKRKAATKRKAGAAIRSFCNWLIRHRVIAENPVRDTRLPRPPAPRTLYLETRDAIRLAEKQPSPYREFSALLAGSGIEVSVALRIRRRDVNARDREVHAHGTKTRSRDRIVRVADWAWPYVERVLEGKLPDALLFAEIPDRWEAGKVHRKAIEALEAEFPVFTGYTMRDARHTYAVRAMRAGAPPDLIARQLGHATPTLVLSVYGRFSPTQDERARWEAMATAMDAELAKEREAQEKEGGR